MEIFVIKSTDIATMRTSDKLYLKNQPEYLELLMECDYLPPSPSSPSPS